VLETHTQQADNNSNKQQVSQNMKIWVVMAKVEELQARSIDKVFDSKEKAYKYITEQEKSEHFVNLAGIDRSIEEWEVE
jgi:Mg2+ and Co2+ transporter CorA